MTEATPSPGADIHSAASAIGGLLDAGESKLPDSKPKTETSSQREVPQAQEEHIEESTQEANESDHTESHESNESDNEPTDNVETEEADAQYELPQSFDQLAQSMGVEPEKLLSMKVKTKIDGQDGEATLADLVKSYQLEGHINKKSMALSEQQKAFDTELHQTKQLLAQRYQEAETYTNIAQNELMREYQNINWAELRQIDPAEFSAKQLEFSNRQSQIQQAAHNLQYQRQAEMQQQQEQHAQLMQKVLAEQKNALFNKIPEWSNPEKQKAEDKDISAYLMAQGFDQNEVKGLIDHRQVVLARKAWLYDKLIASKPALMNKVKSQPTFMKPGMVKGKSDITQQQKQSKMKQLRKTGSTKDAAAALADFL